MGEHMNVRRLLVARNDEALSIASSQVSRGRANPISLYLREFSAGIADADTLKKAMGQRFDAAAINSQTIIGHGTCDGRRAFRDVEPVHPSLVPARQPAAIC